MTITVRAAVACEHDVAGMANYSLRAAVVLTLVHCVHASDHC
jgi:hypothetical protein